MYQEDSPNAVEIQNGYLYWDKKISKEESKKKEAEKRKQEKRKAKKSKKKKNNREVSISDSGLRTTLLTQATETTVESENLDSIEVQEEKTFKFEGLNFSARKGDLVMIIGEIGSGKSSLLQAILGEMRISDFQRTKIFKNTSLSYCG